eukprot:966607-Alexandrium_andersonii.AAC.1
MQQGLQDPVARPTFDGHHEHAPKRGASSALQARSTAVANTSSAGPSVAREPPSRTQLSGRAVCWRAGPTHGPSTP